ncbi:MAG: hypothetical protein ACXWYS_04760 [Gaiellaceae bacterium]
MRAALLLVLVAAALAAPATASTPSGLYGTVTRGPISPVCRVGVPCDGPAARAVFLLVRHGTTIKVRTDARGHYRVRLAPGRYTVRKPDWGPGGIKPSSVAVPTARFARVNLFIDTGIR